MTGPSDLRLRLLCAIAPVVALSQITDLFDALIILCVILLLTLAQRPGAGLWHRLLHIEGFVVILMLTLPFTFPGDPLLGVGFVSEQGVQRAALLGAKITGASLLILSLLGTIEPARLGAPLLSLGLPNSFVRLFLTTIRYQSLIRLEIRRGLDAMRLRGFRPGTNRHTWQSYGNLIGMTLVRCLRRANRIEEAMRCRGYVGQMPNPGLAKPPPRDWGNALPFIALTALIGAMVIT